MVDQVKCPSCGEADVSSRIAVVDRRSGKKVRWYVNLVVGGLLGLCGMTTALGGIAALVSPVGETNPWGLLFGSLIYLVPGTFLLVKYFRADKVRQFEYECAACGHSWEEREEGGESAAPCAACGEHKVATQTVSIDAKSGKILSKLGYEVLGWFLLISGAAGTIFSLVALLVWRDAAWLCFLGWTVMFVAWGIPQLRKYYANQVDVHTCAACGHEWQVPKGGVLPP